MILYKIKNIIIYFDYKILFERLINYMNVQIVKVGELECNCYLLEKDNKILIIDPGDDVDKIINMVGNRDVVGIIITHYHFDHIGALEDVVNRYSVCVYDKNNMEEGIVEIDNFSFNVIYTLGHKDDCITIYFNDEKIMFCGDFIFKDSIGRVDLPGGNINEMINSINKIKTYDRDIIIYPGHGDSTTLGYEIDNNLYFKDIKLV